MARVLDFKDGLIGGTVDGEDCVGVARPSMLVFGKEAEALVLHADPEHRIELVLGVPFRHGAGELAAPGGVDGGVEVFGDFGSESEA